jgi:hypothetical protein
MVVCAVRYEYAAARHLPVIYEYDPLVRDGGLMSYGPDLRESLERAASMVDRIFIALSHPVTANAAPK